MSEIASQITSLTIVYSTVHSGADQSKHQSSASLAFVWEIHRWPVNFPHKWPVTRKIFPFDDVIMLFVNHICLGDTKDALRIYFCCLLKLKERTFCLSSNRAEIGNWSVCISVHRGPDKWSSVCRRHFEVILLSENFSFGQIWRLFHRIKPTIGHYWFR